MHISIETEQRPLYTIHLRTSLLSLILPFQSKRSCYLIPSLVLACFITQPSYIFSFRDPPDSGCWGIAQCSGKSFSTREALSSSPLDDSKVGLCFLLPCIYLERHLKRTPRTIRYVLTYNTHNIILGQIDQIIKILLQQGRRPHGRPTIPVSIYKKLHQRLSPRPFNNGVSFTSFVARRRTVPRRPSHYRMWPLQCRCGRS